METAAKKDNFENMKKFKLKRGPESVTSGSRRIHDGPGK